MPSNLMFCLNLGFSTLPFQAPLPSPPGFCPVGLIAHPTLSQSPSVSGRASPPQAWWIPITSPPPSNHPRLACALFPPAAGHQAPRAPHLLLSFCHCLHLGTCHTGPSLTYLRLDLTLLESFSTALSLWNHGAFYLLHFLFSFKMNILKLRHYKIMKQIWKIWKNIKSFLAWLLLRYWFYFIRMKIQWELDYKESWAPKNWCFWTVVLEKTLESPLDCKEIQPVYPKGDQSWVFIGRTDVGSWNSKSLAT